MSPDNPFYWPVMEKRARQRAERLARENAYLRAPATMCYSGTTWTDEQWKTFDDRATGVADRLAAYLKTHSCVVDWSNR